jgi:hypothetical protein
MTAAILRGANYARSKARNLMATVSDKPIISQLLILVVGVCLGMISFWLKDQQVDIDANSATAINNASRLTAIENRQDAVINEIYRRLGTIEAEISGR